MTTTPAWLERLLALSRLATRVLAVIAREARTRHPRLDATPLPTEASGAGTFIVVWPRQRVVAPLAADRIASFHNTAVHDNSAAYSSAQNDPKHDVSAATRAVRCFR